MFGVSDVTMESNIYHITHYILNKIILFISNLTVLLQKISIPRLPQGIFWVFKKTQSL